MDTTTFVSIFKTVTQYVICIPLKNGKSPTIFKNFHVKNKSVLNDI